MPCFAIDDIPSLDTIPAAYGALHSGALLNGSVFDIAIAVIVSG